MKRSVILIVSVVVAITALLFSGKFMSHRQGTATASVQDEGSSLAIGSMAPDFTLKTLGADGKNIQLSSLRGKAVLINLWATWCEPCKVEMPWLVELQKKYGPQGLQILGVAQDDSSEKTIMAFAQKMGLNYPILQGDNHMSDPSRNLSARAVVAPQIRAARRQNENKLSFARTYVGSFGRRRPRPGDAGAPVCGC